jgi:hypothetical protein
MAGIKPGMMAYNIATNNAIGIMLYSGQDMGKAPPT